MPENKIAKEDQTKNIFPKIIDKSRSIFPHFITTNERVRSLRYSKEKEEITKKLTDSIYKFTKKHRNILSSFRSFFDNPSSELLEGLCFGAAIVGVLLEENGFSIKRTEEELMLKVLNESKKTHNQESDIQDFIQAIDPNLVEIINIMGGRTGCNVGNMSLGAAIFLKAYEASEKINLQG